MTTLVGRSTGQKMGRVPRSSPRTSARPASAASRSAPRSACPRRGGGHPPRMRGYPTERGGPVRAGDVTEYNKLTWPEMNDAIEQGKVVLLPTGSTEQHGPHLPLDTDIFLAESVCRELARRA